MQRDGYSNAIVDQLYGNSSDNNTTMATAMQYNTTMATAMQLWQQQMHYNYGSSNNNSSRTMATATQLSNSNAYVLASLIKFQPIQYPLPGLFLTCTSCSRLSKSSCALIFCLCSVVVATIFKSSVIWIWENRNASPLSLSTLSSFLPHP